jgi:hypothetical protein
MLQAQRRTQSMSHECSTDSMAPYAQRGGTLGRAAELGLDLALQVQQPLGLALEALPAEVSRNCLSRRSSSSTPSSASSAAMRLDSADCVTNSFLGGAGHALERCGPVEGFDKAQVHARPRLAPARRCGSKWLGGVAAW